jgi:hypothetical protein
MVCSRICHFFWLVIFNIVCEQPQRAAMLLMLADVPRFSAAQMQ